MLKDFLADKNFTQEDLEGLEDIRIIYSKDYPIVGKRLVGYEVFSDVEDKPVISKNITGEILKFKKLTENFFWMTTNKADYILKVQ